MAVQVPAPGTGGIDRGKGDAPLFYGEESHEKGVSFKAERLPRGFLPSGEWQVTGLSRSRPGVDPKRDAGAGGKGAAGAGRATFRRRVAPRHRAVLRRFFEKKGG